MFKNSLAFLAVLTFFSLSSQAQFGSRKIDLECKHIGPIEHSYLQRHITYQRHNKNLDARTVDQFIKKMDPTKIYLLNKDVKDIKKMMKNISRDIRQRKCTPIEKAHAIYKKRVADRVAFAKSYLGKKFKFNKKTKFTFDPDQRKTPVTQAQANNFLKNYIQFQVANYLATDIKLAEAKTNVIKSYDRVLRRVNEFSKQDLWSLYLDSFAHSLDPHSSYLSADQLEDFEIQMRLSLDGIGATLSSKDGFTVIEQLIPGGAAAGSGKLKPKDKIMAVAQGEDGKFENVIEEDLRDVVRKIRGKKGSKVRLSILRKGEKGTSRFEVTLIRASIKLEDEAAQAHYFDRTVNGKKQKIALLNLPSFYADSRKKGRSATKDLAKLITEAKKKKAKGIVLDLSTNGGGSLEDAVNIAGLFFKKGAVVKQSHRDASRGEQELSDENPVVNWSGPLVILISRISASASEIVSGSLKDYKRAVVVGGDHTFGKGSVQSVEPLPPGLGALKTTVGMFFTAGGHSTQHRGVDADIVFPSAYSTDEIGEKTLDYSLPPKKIKSFLSGEAYVTTGPSAWKKIDKGLITKLSKRSKQRIAASKDFKKIKDNIKKAKNRGKVIKVSEVLDKKGEDKTDLEKENGDTKVLTREEKMKKYLERADIIEAVDIMADLIAYDSGMTPMVIGSKPKKKGKVKAN